MPLKLVKRPKSPFWIIRGTVRGVRVEESAGTANRGVAEEIRAKRESEILQQSVYGRRATCTFAEAALSYIEIGGETRYLAKIIDHFGSSTLAKIDQDAIDRGARKIYPTAKNSTKNRQFYAPIVAVMNHAAKRKWCDAPMIERLDEGKLRVRYLTPAEADRLIAACAPHLAPLVIFLLYTGCRVGEGLWLDWRHIDLVTARVFFPKTKNGEPRGVGLHPRVVAALANLPHREGDIFRTDDGSSYTRPKGDHDKSAGTRIKTAFKGACRRAGIVDFRPHDCRHTWATWVYAATPDLIGLQRLGGWKTLSMVQRYAHVNRDALYHLIAGLPGGNLGEAVLTEDKVA